MASETTGALLLAVVGGSVSVADESDVAAFGTVPMRFGLAVGTRAHLFPDAGSSGAIGASREAGARGDET